jgi:signal transduction histidine kinase
MNDLQSRFISLISHEFRTPLSIIMATNDLLDRRGERLSTEQRKTYFDVIRSQVHHLSRLLDDMLAISEAESAEITFQPEVVKLNELCRSIAAEYAPILEGHELVLEAVDPECLVLLDPALFRQAILNLLSNAVKYSPAGSAVQMRVASTESEIEVTIQDAGIGIPKADLQYLFTPFHRAPNAALRPGLGLGLTIVKHAVQRHGGSVFCLSQEGVGTTFTLRIPRRPTTDHI